MTINFTQYSFCQRSDILCKQVYWHWINALEVLLHRTFLAKSTEELHAETVLYDPPHTSSSGAGKKGTVTILAVGRSSFPLPQIVAAHGAACQEATVTSKHTINCESVSNLLFQQSI